mmetsp:Transcript_21178/g.60259  ORF Transcript_21178/g.60259 Transcript_21178/m.60259 type:complete len:269 (+) Transcript_21178:110-916(+)
MSGKHNACSRPCRDPPRLPLISGAASDGAQSTTAHSLQREVGRVMWALLRRKQLYRGGLGRPDPNWRVIVAVVDLVVDPLHRAVAVLRGERGNAQAHADLGQVLAAILDMAAQHRGRSIKLAVRVRERACFDLVIVVHGGEVDEGRARGVGRAHVKRPAEVCRLVGHLGAGAMLAPLVRPKVLVRVAREERGPKDLHLVAKALHSVRIELLARARARVGVRRGHGALARGPEPVQRPVADLRMAELRRPLNREHEEVKVAVLPAVAAG